MRLYGIDIPRHIWEQVVFVRILGYPPQCLDNFKVLEGSPSMATSLLCNHPTHNVICNHSSVGQSMIEAGHITKGMLRPGIVLPQLGIRSCSLQVWRDLSKMADEGILSATWSLDSLRHLPDAVPVGEIFEYSQRSRKWYSYGKLAKCIILSCDSCQTHSTTVPHPSAFLFRHSGGMYSSPILPQCAPAGSD